MILIEDYILKSKTERQLHLKLDELCIERGGKSTFLKGLLAHILDTTIPSGFKILLCHACHNDKCSNPNHLYWGTPKENRQDAMDCGARLNSPYDYILARRGEEAARLINIANADPSKAGKGNKGKVKSEDHKRKISEAIKAKHKLKNAGMAELVDATDSKSVS